MLEIQINDKKVRFVSKLTTRKSGNYHAISFSPLHWEKINKIWDLTSVDRKFVAVANADGFAVLRVSKIYEDNVATGICSGYSRTKTQFLFMDYDGLSRDIIYEELNKIMKEFGLRRMLIVQTRPKLEVQSVLNNSEGTNFYDFNREKAYLKLINGVHYGT